MNVRLEHITPDKARAWLGNSVPNRHLRKTKVHQYARDILAGRWKQNGDTIKFTQGGELCDGQHRLHAVIEANKPVDMLVAYGVSPDSIITIDTGISRGFHDVLAMSEVANASLVASAARWWIKYERGSMFNNAAASHQELSDMVDRHPSLLDAARRVGSTKEARRLVSASGLTFVYAYVAERDKDAADIFLDTLESGVGLRRGDAVFALRRALIKNLMRNSKLPQADVIAMTIKAFNAMYAGKSVEVIAFRSGESAEPFPRFGFDDPAPQARRKAPSRRKAAAKFSK